jgi:hypothetical protein
MSKYIFTVGGGLGDIVYAVYMNNFASYLKTKILGQMDAKLKVLIICHNPYAREIFENQDWIDEIKPVPYTQSIIPYQKEFEGYIGLNQIFDIKNPIHTFQIELTESEKEKVNKLTEKPFIILHPKGGQDDRNITSKMLEEIYNLHEFDTIYVTGKNFERISHSPEVNPFPDKENVVDLIDQLNVRETIELIRNDNCKYVHATHSAISMIAWIFKKDNTLYYPIHPANNSAYMQIMDVNVNQWNFGKWYKNTKLVPIYKEIENVN